MTRDEALSALGLGNTFTSDQLRAAYRAAAKRAHPDAGGSAEQFQQVTLAHSTLAKGPKRKAHDPRAVCPTCDGNGWVVRARAWRAVRARCPACKGTGVSH